MGGNVEMATRTNMVGNQQTARLSFLQIIASRLARRRPASCGFCVYRSKKKAEYKGQTKELWGEIGISAK